MCNSNSPRLRRSPRVSVTSVLFSISFGWFLHSGYAILRYAPNANETEILVSPASSTGCLDPVVSGRTTPEGLRHFYSSGAGDRTKRPRPAQEPFSELVVPEFLAQNIIVNKLIDALRLANTLKAQGSVGRSRFPLISNLPLRPDESSSLLAGPILELDPESTPRISLKAGSANPVRSERLRAARSLDFQLGANAAVGPACDDCISLKPDSFDAPLLSLYQSSASASPNSESSVSSLLNATQREAPSPHSVRLGQTEDQIESLLGTPEQLSFIGHKVIYTYENVRVTFVDGKVTDIKQ
jgi:hypothetical protein